MITDLHADDSIDKEQHRNKQYHIRQRLQQTCHNHFIQAAQLTQVDRAMHVPGSDLAGGRRGAQLKLRLTKTMINNARQLSRGLVGINH